MTEDVLQAFVRWASQQPGVAVTQSAPSANPSARIDIESRAVMARITIWAVGSCDAEVLDYESGETKFYKHWDVLENSNFDALFRDFFYAIDH